MKIPSLKRRADDGRFYVRDPHLKRPVYFGRDQRQADAAYRRWVADFAQRQPQPTGAPSPRCTVAELLATYLAQAKTWYTKRGQETSRLQLLRRVAVLVRECWDGRRDASSIRGPDVIELQKRLVGSYHGSMKIGRRKLKRTTINKYVRAALSIWRWGVGQDAVDVAALERMRAVAALKKGRTEAVESKRIKPVPPEHLQAALLQLRPPVDAMVKLQLLGGCRPGEICALRPCDLDRIGPVWAYRVAGDWDKTEHRKEDEEDRPRVVWFGPQAQAILAPLLDRVAPESLLKHAVRPLFVNHRGQPIRTKAYGSRIERACLLAGVPVFRPNRIRHTRATDIRAKYGIEAARVALGHTDVAVTTIYAERDDALGRRVALETG